MRLPFFYGWVVLACVCLAGFARQGPAVAVLSVFMVPMTDALGWTRTEMAGAVSLGGVLGGMFFAGAAMAMSSVSVVTSSLMLKRWRPRTA